MNVARLLTLYERVADAPDAIARLRRFILDLAVHGKLVPQDPTEEPASELLKQIAGEKARLVRGGGIGPDRKHDVVASSRMSSDLRTGWHLANLEQVLLELQTGPFGSSLHQNDYQIGGTPVINPASIQNERIVPIDKMAVGPKTLERLSTFKLRAGDVVMARRGEMGRCAVVSRQEQGWLCGTGSLILRPSRFMDPRFLVLLIGSPFAREYLGGTAVGTTMQNLNQGILRKFVFGLPPSAEQRRIVAKVDELMALCDRLEAARAEREARRDRMIAASLGRLSVPDPETFENDAHFALGALPAFTTRPDQIKQLRQTILNLAVRGKLVPQDLDDEPASSLLKRIAAERNRLAKIGELRSGYLQSVGASGRLWTELPAGWELIRVGQVLLELQTGPFGSSLHQSDYQVGGTPVINPASIQNERIVAIDKMAVGPETLARLSSFRLRAGDIVMARRGEMGRCAMVSDQEQGWLCGTGSLILRPSRLMDPRFLVLLIGSPFAREYLGGTAVGTTMQNLNQSILLNLAMGLPPLAEQHRIVAKVDQLIALCDGLELSLAAGDDSRRRLLDALLAEALAPDDDLVPEEPEGPAAYERIPVQEEAA